MDLVAKWPDSFYMAYERTAQSLRVTTLTRWQATQ